MTYSVAENISKMGSWGGRSKRLVHNISVCHTINISDRIAILFFICSLIICYHNFEGNNAMMATWRVLLTQMEPQEVKALKDLVVLGLIQLH